MTMRYYDISSRRCRLPGSSQLPFMILRAITLDIILRYISILGINKANFETLHCVNCLDSHLNSFPNDKF